MPRYIPDARSLARTLAQARLERELAWLGSIGVEADGEVVEADPVERIRAVVAAGGYAGVVVSTLPQRLSRWLHTDLPHRVARAVEVPVVQVEGDAGPSL